MDEDLFRQLPSIRELLERPELLASALPKWALLEAAREAVAKRRRAIQEGQPPSPIEAPELIAYAEARTAPSLRPVINASGVVLHTNLGRAPLAEEAIARVVEVARQYSNLEYNLASGERGSRHDHTARLAAELTGAEDAVIVNNNAAAILLTLSALASKRSVVVSRGELVEIGGSFRIPEILELSGAELVEVGATNRTHIYDYEKAMNDDISVLLKVHRSNFAILGFTSEPDRKELVEICTKYKKILVEDLGSGCLLREHLGGKEEPTPQEAIQTGVDVVTISGDKILGGPQAGIILGRKELLAKIKKHPLARAVRVDKMTLAALEATLVLYRDQKTEALPVWAMFRASQESLLQRAHSLAERLRAICPAGHFAVEPVIERVGGGALPLSELPGAAVTCKLPGQSAQSTEKRLRRANPPVITRVEHDRVYLHLRTIFAHQEAAVLSAFGPSKQDNKVSK